MLFQPLREWAAIRTRLEQQQQQLSSGSASSSPRHRSSSTSSSNSPRGKKKRILSFLWILLLPFCRNSVSCGFTCDSFHWNVLAVAPPNRTASSRPWEKRIPHTYDIIFKYWCSFSSSSSKVINLNRLKMTCTVLEELRALQQNAPHFSVEAKAQTKLTKRLSAFENVDTVRIKY